MAHASSASTLDALGGSTHHIWERLSRRRLLLRTLQAFGKVEMESGWHVTTINLRVLNDEGVGILIQFLKLFFV